MSTDATHKPNPSSPRSAFATRWLWLSILAALCWGGWVLCSKLALMPKEISEWEMQLLFAIGVLPVALLIAAAQRGRLDHSGKGVCYGIVNGLLTTLGQLAFFAALGSGGSTTTVAMASGLYPMVTVLLAVLILRERLTLSQAVSVALVAAAMVCFAYTPSPDGENGTVAFGSNSMTVMHVPPWFWYVMLFFAAWGVVGLLQKLSTNLLSAESAFIWYVVGLVILAPLFYSSKLWGYSPVSLAWGLAGGLLNALGAWAVLAAMKSGGKASIVSPLTALYPLVVVAVAPFLFDESITWMQGSGIVCAVVAVVLLSK